MGMGYSSNWADVISDDNLDELTGGLVKELSNYLEANSEDLDSIAAGFYFDGENIEEDVYEKSVLMIEGIYTAFKKQFPTLEVELDWHDAENGDRYDDISGHYWAISGMRVLSEDGKKIQDKVETVGWVHFG